MLLVPKSSAGSVFHYLLTNWKGGQAPVCRANKRVDRCQRCSDLSQRIPAQTVTSTNSGMAAHPGPRQVSVLSCTTTKYKPACCVRREAQHCREDTSRPISLESPTNLGCAGSTLMPTKSGLIGCEIPDGNTRTSSRSSHILPRCQAGREAG